MYIRTYIDYFGAKWKRSRNQISIMYITSFSTPILCLIFLPFPLHIRMDSLGRTNLHQQLNFFRHGVDVERSMDPQTNGKTKNKIQETFIYTSFPSDRKELVPWITMIVNRSLGQENNDHFPVLRSITGFLVFHSLFYGAL